MCAVACAAIIFLLVWWIVSLKVACVIATITVGIVFGVILMNHVKHAIRKHKHLESLQSVRFCNGKLFIGPYAIAEESVVGASRIHDKANNVVALLISLSNGLSIVIPHKYLHKTATKWNRLRTDRVIAHDVVLPENYVEEEAKIHREFVRLQNCREVDLCIATRAIKAFVKKAMPSHYECAAKNEQEARSVISLARQWMADYLEIGIDESSTEIFNDAESYVASLRKRMQDEINGVARDVVKMESFLFAQINALNPISAYQQYTFFDPKRLPENEGDRLLMLRGLGSPKFAGCRRVIVCSDNQREPGLLKDGGSGVLIAYASDIHAYNALIETPKDERLEFLPEGHPTADRIYIQHPTRTNCYIESSVYHLTLLERKFVELQTVMRSVGAVKMLIDTGDSSARSSAHSKKSSRAIGGKYKVFSGSTKGSVTSEGNSFYSVNSRLCLQGEWDPVQYRKLPDGMEFFDSEPQWKEIATAALKGQSPEVKVRLEIKRESECASKTFGSSGVC